MYSEKTFKNYIFWIQVKRVVLILLLSCIGAALGVLISELCESITKSNAFNVLIIVGSTIIMFLFSLLLTTGTGKEVQDGYWKIAVLRKLTTIQKLIETNNTLVSNKNGVLNKQDINKLLDSSVHKITDELVTSELNDVEYEEDEVENIETKENKEIVKEENIAKKKNGKNNKGNRNKKKRKITKVKELV